MKLETEGCSSTVPQFQPVKHRLATAPKDLEYSSFHRYVRAGMYDLEWGAGRDITLDETIGRE